jgi:hypothetical protein
MPPVLANHQNIRQVKTTSGNSPLTTGQIGEAASQQFWSGTPVMKSNTSPSAGYIIAWDGTSTTNTTAGGGILGISPGDANNLPFNANGAPQQPFGSVQTGANLTFGRVQNQMPPLGYAVNIPRGAPLSDGRLVIELAVPDTWFEAQIDNNAGTASVIAPTLVGGVYGLTVDTSGKWYVDLAKVGAAGGGVLVIKQLNPADPLGQPNGRVWFTFLPTATQLFV